MKPVLTTVISFLIISGISAQDYYSFPDSGWTQTLRLSVYNGFGFERYIDEFTCTGDTTLQGQDYKVILQGGNQYSFVRQEDGKIFSASKQGSNYVEEMLYDFSLPVGDTLFNYPFFSEDLRVIKKEKIQSTSGDSLWYVELETIELYPDTIRWMEGVGDLNTGLLKFFLPDGGFSHICTRNAVNLTLQEASWPPVDCNCDYLHGQDLDHDGHRNSIPLTKNLLLAAGDWPPHYDKPDKHRRCDTLVIFNETGLSFDLLDANSLDGISPDSIVGWWEEVYYFHIEDAARVIISHQQADVYYTIDILECDTQDCNDLDSAAYAGHPEIPYDGVDNDCDSMTLDDDFDHDGFGISMDCDDHNPGIFPGAIEIPYDQVDNDCDSMTLDDDLDLDGFGISEDCNDQAIEIFPGATEIPDNGIDEDCDGSDLITAVVSSANELISVFPNPATSKLYIRGISDPNFSIHILDANGLGRKTFTGRPVIDISSLVPGIYFLQVFGTTHHLMYTRTIAIIR